MFYHKNHLTMPFKTYQLNINPNLLARQAFHTVDTLQKLNFEFSILRSKTVLEYIVESCGSNYYKIFDTKSQKLLDKKQKQYLLEKILGKILREKKALSISSYQKQIWLNVLNHICYQGLLTILLKYQKQFDNYFDSSIEFKYENDKSHNLLKSAFQGMNMQLALWLVENYNFSFWNNYYYYILKTTKTHQIQCIFQMIKLDKIEQYLSFDSPDISIFFSHFKSQSLKIKMLEYITNLPEDKVNLVTLERKNNLIKHLCSYYLEEAHYPVIKFMLQNSYIQENYLGFKTQESWIGYIVSLVVDRYGNHENNITKSKIIWEIFSYIQNHTCIWDTWIREIKMADFRWVDYGESILSYLVKLPKIIPVLKMITDVPSENLSENSNLLLDDVLNASELFKSLLRYGTYETYRYLEPELIKFLSLGDTDIDLYICYALCNKDIRIFKDYIQIWKHKFNYNLHMKPAIEGDFRFIELSKLSLEQKKKRLKLLTKYFTEESIRHKLTNDLYWYYNYIHEIDFYYWYLNKFYQNIITPTHINQFQFELVYKIILKTHDLKLINHLLQISVSFYNYNPILEMILSHGYSWFDDLTQKILRRCTPLKDMTDVQKSNILLKLYYNKNELNFESWDKIVKILVAANFKIKDVNCNNNYLLRGCASYLLNTIKNNQNSFAMALISNGFSFQPVIDYYRKYPYYVSHYDPVKCWMSLYIVIKRLEFKISFRRKKNHSKEFRSTIIDLQSRPPSNKLEKPVLMKGGLLYYRDLDEMECLYGESSLEFQKPIHVEPLDVISWLRKPQGIFSQKADGILVKGLEIDNLYPSFSSSYESRQLDAEYIESLDIYLIFQIRSHVNHQSSFLDDYRELVNEHPMARTHEISELVILESDTESKIRDKLELEFLKIQDFITKARKQKPHTKLWWPKTVYNFSFINPTKKLEVLQIIEEFQRRKFIQLGNHISTDGKFENPSYLPTDGLILMDNMDKTNILKLKPKFQMTADLLYQKSIWRMEWDTIQDKWIPREKRTDKTYPNPPILVRKLQNYHRNPWKLNDIKPFLETTLYYQNQHYRITKKDNDSQEFINQFRKITSKYIQKWIPEIHQYSSNKYLKNILPSTTVLDLGCGFGEKTLWQNQQLEIHGLDVEPQIWLDEKVKCKKHQKFYHDISKSWDEPSYPENSLVKYYEFTDSNFRTFTSVKNKLETKYDYITSFMSFHNVYSKPDGIKNLLDGLQKKITMQSKLIISFLDRDILFPDTLSNSQDKISLTSRSFIHYLGNNKIQYFYNWRHYEPQIEYCLSQTELERDLEKYGWKLESVNENIYHNNLSEKNKKNPWLKVLGSLKLVCFSRIE